MNHSKASIHAAFSYAMATQGELLRITAIELLAALPKLPRNYQPSPPVWRNETD
ncbi:hypothetical protein [Stutzerimonas kunmingensis]|uniref:hypothetical protein n=1 Tax=Stutzerimonas kunmingensis TaxID=1211807 RepID=UPI00241ECE48|nr:hypothetical protein [Stutzerimonas kunmingensis]